MLARAARARPHADDQRLAARAARRAALQATPGLQARHGEPRSLDDATFRAMNDVDFPVAKVLEGIDAAAAAGPRAGQDQHGGQARRERRTTIVPMARALPRHAATSCASSSTWTSATPTAGAWTTSCPRAEIVETIDARDAARAGRRRTTPARSPSAGATATARRDRRHRVGDAGVLPRLHARAPLDRRQALHVPLRAPQGYDLRALLRGGASDDDDRATRSRAIWQRRADRYSEIRTAETAQARKVEMSLHRRLSVSLPPELTNAARPATFEVEALQRARRDACRRRSPASIRSRSTSTSARSSR